MKNTITPFSFQYTRSNSSIFLTQPLHIEENQIIWLVGNSGSGKSTFLHLLKGFYPEFISGQLKGTAPSCFLDAAYIAQNPLTQIVHEHVGEEFFFSMENAGWSVTKMHEARHWLEIFSLDDKEYEKTEHLSHGLSQRLLLSSMLACKPSWVLFDEPTAFLNTQMRDEFYIMLKQLKGHIGMLLIEHHPHASDIADICWHIDDDGLISTMSIDSWQRKQTEMILLESENPNNLWHTTSQPDKIKLISKALIVGYKDQPLFSSNFTLESGDCAILLGENGTGKSTLFNTLAGLQKPLSGLFELSINEQLIKNHSNQMSYVFQHPDSHFYFDTIIEELTQLGIKNPDKLLNKIGLSNGNQSPHLLSEGEKRRLSLLYPFLQKKPLILLDEPTFGQDIINTQRIITLINKLKESGYLLIVITHDTFVQNAIATHIFQINNGQLLTKKVSDHEEN